LQRIISRADIFTFPSRLEGYGMVICESMVNGLPVVCFDNSAMPYTVKDGVNGRLVADGDDAAMADAIGELTSDRTLRDRLSQGALDTVANFMTREKFRETVINETGEIINGLRK
ncbi:MAG: glycosyltransferase, partial [Muribaculaceae bacterium]|nr:glycosyltransferase [Muribaculaceae bacterium]